MKVLLVNKFFFPKGGDAVAYFATADLLRRKGHEPVFFSMAHPENLPSPFSKYFVENTDFNSGGGLIKQLKVATRILYSFEAKRKVERLLDDERPDIVHLHNICHQISPSIIDLFKKRAIPVVMTLHDYKLTCPVYTHLTNKGICESCKGGRFYNVLLKRCTKGSVVKSFINMAEMYLHHNILHIYEKADRFIAPSRFLMEKTKEMGFGGKIVHLSNFVDSTEYEPSYQWMGNSLVYFGRLSEEKGLITLLNAVKGLDVNLKIIGDGPQKDELLEKIDIDAIDNVTFLGYKTGEELYEEIKNAVFIVVPSEWYENNPRSIIESFAIGKPVIGARIGGIPELVKDGETGLTFEAGNADDLRVKVNLLFNDTDKVIEMGKKARKFVVDNYSSEIHYQGLMKIYDEAIEKSKNKGC